MTKTSLRQKRARSKTRTSNNRSTRTPNGYIIFFRIYFKILKNDNPLLSSQQICRLVGKRWGVLPQTLKNEFLMFANVEYQIRNFNSTGVPPGSTVMFDSNFCDESFDSIFDTYINYPPY